MDIALEFYIHTNHHGEKELNIPGLDGGTLQVIDTHTGEVIQTLDLTAQHSLMSEAIESAFGQGVDLHH